MSGMAGSYEAWAWVTLAPDGEETLIGALVGGVHMALINRSRARVEGTLSPIAFAHAESIGAAGPARSSCGSAARVAEGVGVEPTGGAVAPTDRLATSLACRQQAPPFRRAARREVFARALFRRFDTLALCRP